jgi:flagellar basal-body rod modification protein FlgD
MNIQQANQQYFYNQPNAPSPSAAANSASGQASQSLAGNFDTFLKMLTTQLQNQDPLNPTDSNEFTNQLVSFTQVEQAIATNQNLESLVAMQTANQTATNTNNLINYLGKTIGTDLNIAELSNGSSTWTMDFAANASTVSYDIYDSSGAKVQTITDATTKSKGPQTFTWDGSLASGAQAPDGNYFMVPSPQTSAGASVNVTFNLSGTATKVDTVNGQPVLYLGNLPIPMTSIKSVQM